MNILAVAAHADDVEFQCAGTLMLLRERGHDVAIANVNNGSCGSAELPPAEIAAQRAAEARAAAAQIGGRYYNLGIPDLESVFDNPSRRKTAALFRRLRPDLVLTHYPVDYMSDHEIAGRLARDACFTAALPNYNPAGPDTGPPLESIPALYYFMPLEGRDYFGEAVKPSLVVDVEPVMERKVAALCCHASQREWLRSMHGMDQYVAFLRQEAGRIGALDNRRYGEGFRQHRGHAFPREPRLEEALGIAAG